MVRGWSSIGLRSEQQRTGTSGTASKKGASHRLEFTEFAFRLYVVNLELTSRSLGDSTQGNFDQLYVSPAAVINWLFR